MVLAAKEIKMHHDEKLLYSMKPIQKYFNTNNLVPYVHTHSVTAKIIYNLHKITDNYL